MRKQWTGTRAIRTLLHDPTPSETQDRKKTKSGCKLDIALWSHGWRKLDYRCVTECIRTLLYDPIGEKTMLNMRSGCTQQRCFMITLVTKSIDEQDAFRVHEDITKWSDGGPKLGITDERSGCRTHRCFTDLMGEKTRSVDELLEGLRTCCFSSWVRKLDYWCVQDASGRCFMISRVRKLDNRCIHGVIMEVALWISLVRTSSL